MAAVEDCAGATVALSTDAGLTSIESDSESDMKNTARKSTTKLAQQVDVKRTMTPPLVANGNKMDPRGNSKIVVNGDGPAKRPAEEEASSDPAKVARLHLEEMENAQSEMTKKLNRDDSVPSGSSDSVANGKENNPLVNGEVNAEINGKDSHENSSDKTSRSIKGSSLPIAPNIKDNVKELLNVSIDKVDLSQNGEPTSSPKESEPCANNSSEEGKATDIKSGSSGEAEAKDGDGDGDGEDDVVVISSQESVEDKPVEKIADSQEGENGDDSIDEKLLLGEDDDNDRDSNMSVDDTVLLLEEEEEKCETKNNKDKHDKKKEENSGKGVDLDTKDSGSIEKEPSAAPEKEKLTDQTESVVCDSESKTESVKKTDEEGNSSSVVENKISEVCDQAKIQKGEEVEKEKTETEKTNVEEKENRVESKDKSKYIESIPPDVIINLDDDEEEEIEDSKNKSQEETVSQKSMEIEAEKEKGNKESGDEKSVKKDSVKEETSETTAHSKSDGTDSSQRKRPGSPSLSDSSIEPKKSKTETAKEAVVKAEVKHCAETTIVDVDADEKIDIKTDPIATKKVEQEIITLKTEELNDLLMKRMTAFIQKWRGSTVVQLQSRISELQASVEYWRAHAKRLAKQFEEEKAKSAMRKRNSGKMMKRGVNNKDDSRMNQVTAAVQHQQQQQQHLQQQQQQQQQQQHHHQGGVHDMMARTPPRSSPQVKPPPSMQVINNVRINNQTQIRTVTPAQAAQAKASTTVRDLLDKQRGTEPVKKSQTLQIAGGRIVVPGAENMVARKSSTGAALRKAQANTNGPPNKVIDLTDDDDKANKTQTMTVTSSPAGVQLRGAGGQNIRPGTQVLVQPNSSPQVLVASQSIGRTAQGGTLIYTTRPGSIMVQASPGTSLVRPTNSVTSPPALRPANLVTMARGTSGGINSTTVITPRPPPPLRSAPSSVQSQAKHPAPLPLIPEFQATSAANPKQPPPRPGLKISRVQTGIVLSWNMTITEAIAEISNYQLFAYQETAAPPSTSLWKKVGDVKALPLPMACTLTQFQEGNKYHFAVRAVDNHGRLGPFSEPSTIALTVINVS